MSQAHLKPVTMKLSVEALDEAESLVEPLQKLSEYRAYSLSRSTIIRIAIDLGLQELRRQAGGDE